MTFMPQSIAEGSEKVELAPRVVLAVLIKLSSVLSGPAVALKLFSRDP